MKKVENGYSKNRTIGERLKEYRHDHDWTQMALAKELKINIKKYRNYEHDESAMTVDDAVKIADFYNVSLETLLRGKPSLNYDAEKITGLDENSIACLKKFPEISQLLNIILCDENTSKLFFGAIQYYARTPLWQATVKDDKAIDGERKLLPHELAKEEMAWNYVQKYIREVLQKIAQHYNDGILMPHWEEGAKKALENLDKRYKKAEYLRLETDYAENGVGTGPSPFQTDTDAALTDENQVLSDTHEKLAEAEVQTESKRAEDSRDLLNTPREKDDI